MVVNPYIEDVPADWPCIVESALRVTNQPLQVCRFSVIS
jgi:hypothetical protein